MVNSAFQRLVEQLRKLPGIGEKSAIRMAYHLVQSEPKDMRQLAEALVEVSEKIQLCQSCLDLTEQELCTRCRDPRRETDVICVVASPSDVGAIDRGGSYRGLFHVLHGLLSPLDGIGPEDLRIRELLARVAGESPVREVILATSANVDGESTALYVAKVLKPHGIRVSRIARGLPMGGELEYTDQATIARAMEARVEL